MLPEAAGAQTTIPAVDGALRETDGQQSTDPVSKLRRQVDATGDTASEVVEKVVPPAPDVGVTSAPDVGVTSTPDVVVTTPPAVSFPRTDAVVRSSPQRSSPQRAAGKRSGGRTSKAHKRSPTRRHGDRRESSTRLDRDSTRQPDKNDLRQVASAGNEIHPTEVKGLTLTALRRTLLAATGVYLLTWMAAALFLIGLGALSLLSSRPRFARFSLRT
jgi:hypothetical protein